MRQLVGWVECSETHHLHLLPNAIPSSLTLPAQPSGSIPSRTISDIYREDIAATQGQRYADNSSSTQDPFTHVNYMSRWVSQALNPSYRHV